MSEYLYRYISFESFVGLVQNKALTFVLPELWDDPKEGVFFFDFLLSIENQFEKIMYYSIYHKTFGQCWTKLSESDAMWRIYSYNNRAVQIKVDTDKLCLLKDVRIVPVEYTDSYIVDSSKKMESFYKSLAIKRVAFQHENEVRLIVNYKFKSDDDFENHAKAVLSIFQHPQGKELLESLYPGMQIEKQVEEAAKMLNVGKDRQNTLDVSFGNIPDFIAGVKVHPMAPDWYVDVVREYCNRNGITFDGKSALYSNE